MGSLFSGIGGFDLGGDLAGLRTLWQVEIDPEARRVLARHWPGVDRHEDVRGVGRHNLAPVDVITFGSPCQDLSVAGKRGGLAGERSGLFHEAIRIVRELQPTFAVWENVPGAFSSNAGRDFAAVLGAFRDGGARDICWRVLDCQYFGLAQRRKRVFLVADFAGERAAEILLESACRCGHPPARGQAGQGVAATVRSRSHGPGVHPPGRGGEDDQNLVTAPARKARGGKGVNGHWEGRPCDDLLIAGTLKASDGGISGSDRVGELTVTHSLRAVGADASEDGTGRGTPLAVVAGMSEVRRLTPLECARLQGFPDDWLDVDPPLSDSAKYRLLGNAVAVPVAAWILNRLKGATP